MVQYIIDYHYLRTISIKPLKRGRKIGNSAKKIRFVTFFILATRKTGGTTLEQMSQNNPLFFLIRLILLSKKKTVHGPKTQLWAS